MHGRKRSLGQRRNDRSTGKTGATTHCAGTIIPRVGVFRVATIGPDARISIGTHLHLGMIHILELLLVLFHVTGIGRQWLSRDSQGKKSTQYIECPDSHQFTFCPSRFNAAIIDGLGPMVYLVDHLNPPEFRFRESRIIRWY